MKKIIKQKLKFIKKLLPKKKKEKQKVVGINNILQILKTKRTFAMIFMCAIILSALAFIYPNFLKTKAVVYSPGNVLINEFYTKPDVGLDQWYELMNTTSSDIDLSDWVLSSAINGEINIGTALGLDSKILPANGLITIDLSYNPADDLGDILQIKDPTSQAIHAVSYGNQVPGGMQHADAPADIDESAIRGLENWSITTNPSRGWFNESETILDCGTMSELTAAPVLSDLDACLDTLIGVVSNIGEIADPSRTPNDGVNNLYFEKQDLGIPIGKIKYNVSLNLTDANTMALLIALGNKMDIAAGEIAFDASMSEMMRASGAEITIYSIDDLGYAGTPNIIVRDDLGEIISPENPNYPSLADISYSEEGGDLTFSTNHFTGFEVGPTITEISVLTATSNTTPEYTFNTDVAGIGNITYGGSCTSATFDSVFGSNTIIFDPLSEGIHDDCAITVTDGALHSATLNVSSFTIDTMAPTIAEATPVPSLTNDNTPSYTFTADEVGTIEYNGNYCAGDLTEAVAGANTTVLYDWNTDDVLEDGLYSGNDCTIEVRDTAGNLSDILNIEFTIDTIVSTVSSLGDGLSDYELPSTCPSSECDNGDVYGVELFFDEELNVSSKTAVEDAINAGASVAPRAFAWNANRVIIYATQYTVFTQDVWAQISDDAGNINVVQLIDTGSASVQVNDANPVDISDDDAQLIIPETTTEVNVNIDENSDNSVLNLGAYKVDGEIAESPEINITKTLASGDNVIVNIPAGTSITADDASWNGVINVPQTKDNSTVTIGGGTVDGVVEVGFDNIKLTFGNAVRLFFQGKADKRIGYSRDGLFTEITAVCADDSQVAGDALPVEGDCRIVSGDDMVVWTKHFTSFVTYISSGSSPSYSVLAPPSDTGLTPPLTPEAEEALRQIQFGIPAEESLDQVQTSPIPEFNVAWGATYGLGRVNWALDHRRAIYGLYASILGRRPTAAEVNGWLRYSDDINLIRYLFLTSEEYLNKH